MITTLLILVATLLFFVIGNIRADLVAVCSVILLIVCGILTPSEALAGYSNPVIIMMIGLFVVGNGIFHTGLAEQVSNRLLGLAGSNPLKLHILVMVVTAGLSALISNTGTVALMIPIVVSLAAKAHISAGRLLIPLAFASSTGGLMTLIGTPPNLVIQEVLEEHKLEPVGFFTFFPMGFIATILGIILLYPLSKWLFAQRKEKADVQVHKPSSELLKEYELHNNLLIVDILQANSLIDKSVKELDIHRRFGLTILEVRRHGARKSLLSLWRGLKEEDVNPDTTFHLYDRLFIMGNKEDADRFIETYGLNVEENDKVPEFYEVGLSEVMIPFKSKYINETAGSMKLRERYGLNILAIRRYGQIIAEHECNGNENVKKELKDIRLRGGDILLVEGLWDNLTALSAETEDCTVLGIPEQRAEGTTVDHKAPAAAIIMLAMVAALTIPGIPIPAVAIVMIAAVAMIVTGCIRNVDAAYKSINWESMVLIASMIPMATALDKTGISRAFSQLLVEWCGAGHPIMLLAGVYVAGSLLTLFINNTATAVLMAPIAIGSAQTMGVSPYPFLFAIAISTSLAFATPFATPPNALVMTPGHYHFMDYIKTGLPLQIIIGIVMVLILPLFFAF